MAASADLDDYRTPGYYYSNANVDCAQMGNHPSGLAGVLHVQCHTGSSIVIQTWSDYSINGNA